MHTKRILIIEDDADAADVLEAYLTRENYEVSVAGDGLSGLEKAQRRQTESKDEEAIPLSNQVNQVLLFGNMTTSLSF